MGIEKFGESLLSNVRARNEKVQRDADKRAERDALKSLAIRGIIGIGNRYLQKQASNFVSNEDILASTALYKNANFAATGIIDEMNAMQQDEVGRVDPIAYEMNLMRPEFVQQFNNQLEPEEIGTSAYNSYIDSELRKIATQRYNKKVEFFNAAKKIKTREEFDASVAANITNALPLNVGDAISDGILGIFSGQDKATRQQAAIDAISQNDPLRERVLALKTEYDKTKNLISSFDYATATSNESATEKSLRLGSQDRFKIVERSDIVTSGDSAYIKTQKFKVDRYGEIPEEQQGKVEIEIASKGQADRNALKALKSNFDFVNDGRMVLTSTAMGELSRKATEEGISLTNITSVSDYSKVSELFQGLTNQDENIQNKFADDMTKAFIDSLVKNSVDIQAELLTGTPEEAYSLLDTLAEYSKNFLTKVRQP